MLQIPSLAIEPQSNLISRSTVLRTHFYSPIRTMAGSNDYKFIGWLGLDKNADQGNMVWQEFEPKTWEETDVDIQVTHSGICGSDLHVLRSGWVSPIFKIQGMNPALKRDRVRRHILFVSVTRSSAELCG